jgi:hypothetical protein
VVDLLIQAGEVHKNRRQLLLWGTR